MNSHLQARRCGTEVLLEVLVDEGIDSVFELDGGASAPVGEAAAPRVASRRDARARHIGMTAPVAGQSAGCIAAAFMAAGHARACGKVGVCIIPSGPGTVAALAVLADCGGAPLPLVLICCGDGPPRIATAGLVKRVVTITDPARFEGQLRAAVASALSGRPGTVLVILLDGPGAAAPDMTPRRGEVYTV
jgi:acetolactate synthase-1/2/3 large subunit